MARSGTLDTAAFAALNSREIRGFKTDAWMLKGAQILNVNYEIDNDLIDTLLPPALHPVVPAYGVFHVTHYPESPVGEFSIAEVRIIGRAGVRTRAFVLRSYVDNEATARELANRWGYPAFPGKVSLRVFHDRVVGRVTAEGRNIFEVEMLDRDTIAAADIQLPASHHLARNTEDGRLSLVQVDPEWVFTRAERGRPNVVAFDPEAWGAPQGLAPEYPIVGIFTVADVTLSKIRYVSDPDLDAFRGTVAVAA